MSVSAITTCLASQELLEIQHDDIQPELLDLIKKVDELVKFTGYHMETFHTEYRSAREIYLGYNTLGSGKVFIKTPRLKYPITVKPYAIQEQVAFLISERLNFKVVPSTMALTGYKWIRQDYSKEKKEYLSNGIDDTCEGVVLQEGISLHPDQLHMNNTIIKTRMYCLMNLYLSDEEADKELEKNAKPLLRFGLNVDQICKAIFFNIVTGRTDAGKRNSVIDESKMIFEVDNERIGNSNITDSWLLATFSDCVISNVLIDDFLAKDISIIDKLFEEMKQRFGRIQFWNHKSNAFDIEDKSKEIITLNFVGLQKFLLARRGTEIKVKHLRAQFYQRPSLDML